MTFWLDLAMQVTFYMQNCHPAAIPPLCDLFAGTQGAFQGRPLEFGPPFHFVHDSFFLKLSSPTCNPFPAVTDM